MIYFETKTGYRDPDTYSQIMSAKEQSWRVGREVTKVTLTNEYEWLSLVDTVKNECLAPYFMPEKVKLFGVTIVRGY